MTEEQFIQLFASWRPERRPNPEQEACIGYDASKPLMIAAGPGTGKTTVLVLRALRMVLVDRIRPEQIMITTFTKKAAREIVTRLIEWGYGMFTTLRTFPLSEDFSRYLESVDINRFVTGTFDSVCEDALGRDRTPAEVAPIVVESFSANTLLARLGHIFEEDKNCPGLRPYLRRYTEPFPPRNLSDLTKAIRSIVDRFCADLVDVEAYGSSRPDTLEKSVIVRIFENYTSRLSSEGRLDFGMLEKLLQKRIAADLVPGSLRSLRCIMVDEYQDTNPLQESLYFSITRATGAVLNIVGDDDQSLFRFRGATMELFRDFCERYNGFHGADHVERMYLFRNYRSHPEIVDFINDYIEADPDYLPARIQPSKPKIRAMRESKHVPVFGLFREDVDTLATDLASMLFDTFEGSGWRSPRTGTVPFVRSSDAGNYGDAVLLASTVRELSSAGNDRLPGRLRYALAQRNVEVFNPRGRSLSDVGAVSILLGLVISSIDPTPVGGVAEQMPLTSVRRDAFARWRHSAQSFVDSGSPAEKRELLRLLARWQSIAKTGKDTKVSTAREWPILDVIYSFIRWLPDFQEDPEHQIYLEAISRAAAEAATFSKYRSNIVSSKTSPISLLHSIQGIIRDVLGPLADGSIQVDEDIMPTVPRNRLSMMTIHQAKGLEFPLAIVDVSSDFSMDHPMQRFRRFPTSPSSVTILEHDLAPFTSIGAARLSRTDVQRSFDDLVRQFYVAYSRARTALILVGLENCVRYEKAPKNVATFWRRDGTWAWREGVRENRVFGADGKRRKGVKETAPLLADNCPLVLL